MKKIICEPTEQRLKNRLKSIASSDTTLKFETVNILVKFDKHGIKTDEIEGIVVHVSVWLDKLLGQVADEVDVSQVVKSLYELVDRVLYQKRHIEKVRIQEKKERKERMNEEQRLPKSFFS